VETTNIMVGDLVMLDTVQNYQSLCGHDNCDCSDPGTGSDSCSCEDS